MSRERVNSSVNIRNVDDDDVAAVTKGAMTYRIVYTFYSARAHNILYTRIPQW